MLHNTPLGECTTIHLLLCHLNGIFLLQTVKCIPTYVHQCKFVYVDSLFLSIFPQVHTQNTGEELSDSTMSALLLITALSHLSAVTNQGGVMLSQRALQLLFTYVLATRFLSSEMSMRVSANFFYQVSFSFLQQLFIINSGYYAILVSNTSSELTSCLYFLLESSDKRC